LRGQAGRELVSRLEEVTAHDDKVMVVVHTPGIDQRRARQADDRNYLVLTLQDGRIIAMRGCRDRAEARSLAGIG
jgi:ketosteroid isomerase-like protein